MIKKKINEKNSLEENAKGSARVAAMCMSVSVAV